MRYIIFLFMLIITSPATAQLAGGGVEAGKGAKAATITHITIHGNATTRRSVILRELSIDEGQAIVTDSIEQLTTENRLRLFNLQLFNEVDQHVEADTGHGINWVISVKERWYIIPTGILQFADRNINTWWVDQNHDLRRVSAGLTITDKNFRGNLESLAITAQAGYTQRLGISYMRPYANRGQTHGFGFWGGVAQSRQAYYATMADKLVFTGGYTGPVLWRQAEGGLSYVYRPAYKRRHIIQGGYRQYSVGDTILKLNPDYYSSGSRTARFFELSYRYEFNGVDNWNYSLRGLKLVATAVSRAGIEGLRFQNFANVEAGLFLNPRTYWYVALIGRGKLMYPQSQPYYFRGGLGTATDYVRGYEYYVTDGYNYGVFRADLKRQLFSNTYALPIRYFTAIPLRIYPKLFFDAGYNQSPFASANTLSNRLLYSIGAGIDIVTLYDVKIRLEYARNHLGQNGLYLHFNSE